jgi:thioredoxin-dependent peroxiredoxin
MLEAGTNAPAFSLPDQYGKVHQLADYKGKWVLLYFYPKDMTPGCTVEACNFRDDFPAFGNLDAVILGVSKDSIARHKKFAEKYDLPFTLLSDEDGTICEAYGVWKEKSMYGKTFMGINRSTFLIDPDGKIARVYPKVKVKEHAAELLRALDELK